MKTLILIPLASALVSWLLTGRLRAWAPRIGLIDAPDNRRKAHKEPVPLGGGLGVLVGTLAACCAAAWFDNAARDLLNADRVYFIGLAAAATAIALIGLLDDRCNLRGRQKLLAQAAVCVAFTMASGLRVDAVALFQYKLQFGIFAVPITVGWLLFAVKAFNLIDGVDGLAGTLGTIISLALASWRKATPCEIFSSSASLVARRKTARSTGG